jgi:hypothetical protein
MLPNMSSAVMAWMQSMRASIVRSVLQEFETQERLYPVDFRGVRVPFKAQQLDKKPEGQRAWRWEVLYATPELVLQPNDVIQFNCVRYRVDAKLDYSEYGYCEYHIVQDFTT